MIISRGYNLSFYHDPDPYVEQTWSGYKQLIGIIYVEDLILDERVRSTVYREKRKNIYIRVVPDIQPFLYPVYGRISGSIYRISGRMSGWPDNRISG